MTLFRLRFSTKFSRMAVYFVFGSTLLLGSTFIYQQRINNEPLRFGKDQYGNYRWITKLDILIIGLQDLKQKLKVDPNNKEIIKAIEIIRNEIQKEKLKNNNSNNLIDDSDIDEDGITEDDLVLK